VRARVLTADRLAGILRRRRLCADAGETQQGYCPRCDRPLYLFLAVTGPSWTCGCGGPEKDRAAADAMQLELARRRTEEGRPRPQKKRRGGK